MRGLVLAGVRRIEVRDDLPEPVLEQPTDAIVRVLLAGVCGSDLHPWAGREPFRPGVVPGHEVVGEVTAVGPDVTSFGVGDRVVVPFTTSCGTCPACRRGLSSRCEHGQLFGWGDPDPDGSVLHGGQAEALRVPLADGTLLALPERLDLATGVLLADNLPTGWYAALRAQVVPDEPALVLGCGAVGLCAVVALHAMGARPVVATDPIRERRDRAARLGARATAAQDVDEVVAELTAGEGVPSVVDAAGSTSATAAALRCLRPGGTLQVVAVPTRPELDLSPVEAYDRNLTLRFGRAPVRSLLDDVVAAVLDGRLRAPAQHLVTGPPLPLEAGAEAYERAASGADGVGKLLLDPSLS